MAMKQSFKDRLALISSELQAATGSGAQFELAVILSVVLCLIMFFSIVWLGNPDSTRSERVIIINVLLQFLYWLITFHFIAWFIRRWVPKTLVGVLDYFYLGTAVLGLTISALRQEVEHSQYAALWFPTALPWLVAALALRLTKTTIEVFGWYRRPAS
jgi:hypothetical protein